MNLDENNDIIVYLVNIKNKSIDDIFTDYKSYIDDKDIQKMDRFKFILNKKQSIMSSILKNKYVKGDIYFNEHGKPLSDSLYFNEQNKLESWKEIWDTIIYNNITLGVFTNPKI